MDRIVIDTNVFVSALMSVRGVSSKLIELAADGAFTVCLSVPLVVEYEEIGLRLQNTKIFLSAKDIESAVDSICTFVQLENPSRFTFDGEAF